MEAKEIISRLCLLTSEVQKHIGHECHSDCFCGDGRIWLLEKYDGTHVGGYRHDGKTLEFIEEAVREKIKSQRITK